MKGNAPYMLVFFGTPFTHDGPYGFFDEFYEAGYGIISPARPGYARTPITSGRTYKEQPDLYAAMLDKLGVDKVVVHSISGGGPAAYSFARQYPDRCHCLIPECSVSGNLTHEKLGNLDKWYFKALATSPLLAQATAAAPTEQALKGIINSMESEGG